jgi:hypothetical protein
MLMDLIFLSSECIAKHFFYSPYRLLHSDRDAIPDVPAVYFVLPTEENIKRICQV